MTCFDGPQGHWNLQRYPVRNNDPLRAWDAADEYLLEELAAHSLPSHPDAKVVVVNDSFAALCCCLHPFHPNLVSDSFLTQMALEHNCQLNEISPDNIVFYDSLTWPEGLYDLAIIKLPKSLALLEDQLLRLRPHLTEQTVILGAGMVKHMTAAAIELFETIIGPTTTSLARKKARLIRSTYSPSQAVRPAYDHRLQVDEYNLSLFQHAGVFSLNKLDQGSRLFLENSERLPEGKTVIDLGCGNGVLGLVAARKMPEAEFLFVDESFRAVDSARRNFTATFGTRPARFCVTDCLMGIDENSAELIINNPPFHQQQAVGDHIAWQMFRQSRKVLQPGGQLWIVGNRHLGYHTKLKRLFGNCELIASNRKFVLLRAVRY